MRIKAKYIERSQGLLTIAWAALAVPSVLWWSESIRWVVVMSVYANVAASAAGWAAARAERSNGGTDD